MKKTRFGLFGILGIAALLALGNGVAVAGGQVDTGADRFAAADFDSVQSEDITNPWWTLTADQNWLYFSESEDGCEWNLVQALPATTHAFGGIYAGVDARVVLDRAWLDEECTYENFADAWANVPVEEQTYDWYAQDADENIWYMGEDTFDGEHSGSFTAGCDGAEAGIVILGDPSKGTAYKQEYYEDEAEDWGKVLNFFDTDGQECMMTKEWSPLEHGNVEHKFYCHDDPAGPGQLVLVNELHGKTVVQELVDTNLPAADVPPGPSDDIYWEPQCPPYTGP